MKSINFISILFFLLLVSCSTLTGLRSESDRKEIAQNQVSSFILSLEEGGELFRDRDNRLFVINKDLQVEDHFNLLKSE